jgi:hypothetical protein
VAPVITAFVNGDASKAAGLVADVQKLAEARKEKGLKTFVVFMGGPELKEPIEKIATERHITIPMTFLPQGTSAKDIGAYKINPEAKNTILIWKGQRVTKSFVDVDNTTIPEIEKAVDAMLQ